MVCVLYCVFVCDEEVLLLVYEQRQPQNQFHEMLINSVMIKIFSMIEFVSGSFLLCAMHVCVCVRVCVCVPVCSTSHILHAVKRSVNSF